MKIGSDRSGHHGQAHGKNILKNGYTDLMVSDLNKAAVDEVVAAGAKAATNQEIGEQCRCRADHAAQLPPRQERLC